MGVISVIMIPRISPSKLGKVADMKRSFKWHGSRSSRSHGRSRGHELRVRCGPGSSSRSSTPTTMSRSPSSSSVASSSRDSAGRRSPPNMSAARPIPPINGKAPMRPYAVPLAPPRPLKPPSAPPSAPPAPPAPSAPPELKPEGEPESEPELELEEPEEFSAPFMSAELEQLYDMYEQGGF